jgi:hypothetical protein
MLSQPKVVAALEQKREAFRDFYADQGQELAKVASKLDLFSALSYAEIQAMLSEIAETAPWTGAVPTEELEEADRLRLPFSHAWHSHAEARTWAMSVLEHQPVAAVDGSQIMPDKNDGLPVAAVQIGWYINPHCAGTPYEKDVSFDIIAPDELQAEQEGEADYASWLVNQVRFEAECAKLAELMNRFAALPETQRPLCYFDGSFIVSFAGLLRPERARPYLKAVEQLLDVSTALRVPLVGFVDSSGSRDLVQMLNLVTAKAGDTKPYVSLTDGTLVDGRLVDWGDRTPLFQCARNDKLSSNGHADFYRQVVFSYVNLGAGRPPARVEMPRWLWDAGRAGWVMDMVRAECIAGARGYPYAIETADAVAVIQQADRERFYAILQQFAEREGINMARSRKALSKQLRRG